MVSYMLMVSYLSRIDEIVFKVNVWSVLRLKLTAFAFVFESDVELILIKSCKTLPMFKSH